ncbi:MAG: hypothetical protein NTW50_04135 [Candidatus Berkelbacteria bacterium]|nr:hypothetical protein [Candidatus Berkelbacteria bacterium]
MKYSCQNLTQLINTLGQLKSDLDLALGREKPDIEKGLRCQKEATEIISKLNYFGISLKTYNFLVEKVGNHVELEKRISSLEIGGDSAEQLQTKLEAIDPKTGNRKFNIPGYTQRMIDEMYKGEEFQKLAASAEKIQTILLKVGHLGFTSNPTTDQIYARAFELGLELCPAGVGPYQLLKAGDQPMEGWHRIAMKQIAGLDGNPSVFGMGYFRGILCFSGDWMEPNRRLNVDPELMFRLREPNQSHK